MTISEARPHIEEVETERLLENYDITREAIRRYLYLPVYLSTIPTIPTMTPLHALHALHALPA